MKNALKDAVCWLVQFDDLDVQSEKTFTTDLCALARTTPDATPQKVIDRISMMEREVLVPQSPISSSEQARFFFLGGRLFQQFTCLHAADEYYALCARRIALDDSPALLLLHTRWGPVAEAVCHPLAALRSYEMVLHILQTTPAYGDILPDPPCPQEYQQRIACCRAQIIRRPRPTTVKMVGARPDFALLQ